jgi:hypothetical protein
MKMQFVAYAFTALMAFQASADAAIVTVLPAGQTSNGGTIASFNGLPQAAIGSTTPAGAFTDGGASFSGTGLIMNNPGQASGFYAQPLHTTTNYLAVLGGGSETITYSGERHSFGLYWGSIDAYNTISFFTNSGDTTAFLTYSGSQLPSLVADGSQTSDASNRYVTFSDIVFSKVVLSSGRNSFEVDNISAGVPELSTWAMMLIGFGGLGFAAYRRSRKVSAAAFA